MREFELIRRLIAPIADHPAARGLLSDAAVLETPGGHLVATKDMMAEGVHWLPSDPPESVGWRLAVVNLSDLAATGAQPLACLLGLGLAGHVEPRWVEAVLAGLAEAGRRFGMPLIGGDTIASGERTVLSLTALGSVEAGRALARTGARPGDRLWVSGAIGDAGAGLAIARRGAAGVDELTLLNGFLRPAPRLDLGAALAGVATACADVSDGLAADAGHIATASRCAIALDLAAVPLSDAYRRQLGDTLTSRIAAATSGDDYELAFTARPEATDAILALSQRLMLNLTPIGAVRAGAGLTAYDAAGNSVPLGRTGYEHGDGGQGQDG